MDTYDAVVAGGGPAGSAFAITLAAAGRSVAVLDRGASPGLRSVDVLPPEVRPVLAELGVWERFRSAGHRPAPGILAAWGRAEPVAHDHIRNCFGEGWHVDRRRFADMLLDAAGAAGAIVWPATRVTRASEGAFRGGPGRGGPGHDRPGHGRGSHGEGGRGGGGLGRGCDGGGWHVDAVTDGRAIGLHAGYFVEATGRAASLTRLPAAKATACDRLVGVLATVEPSCTGGPTDHRMLVEASANGWWYSARLPDARSIVTWMTDPDVRERCPGTLGDLWHRELDGTLHTRLRVPGGTGCGVGVVAANSWVRRAACGRRLAVGDAAAAYDPLSGHGVLRALRTGQLAAAAVVAAQDGSAGALDRYADGVAEQFGRYVRLRRGFYRGEHRWPDSLFWRRRQA